MIWLLGKRSKFPTALFPFNVHWLLGCKRICVIGIALIRPTKCALPKLSWLLFFKSMLPNTTVTGMRLKAKFPKVLFSEQAV